MNKTPSVVERFLSDTPPFFKKLHAIGLLLIGLSVTLAGLPQIPAKASLIVGIVGGTLAVVSMFAMKDIATLESAPSIMEGALKLVPDLAGQFAQLKNIVVDATTSHANKLEYIATAVQALQKPVALAADHPLPAPGNVELNLGSSTGPAVE